MLLVVCSPTRQYCEHQQQQQQQRLTDRRQSLFNVKVEESNFASEKGPAFLGRNFSSYHLTLNSQLPRQTLQPIDPLCKPQTLFIIESAKRLLGIVKRPDDDDQLNSRSSRG